MNVKFGKQNCKECMWYDSCKNDEALKRDCEDYDPVNEYQQVKNQYINNLNERQADYIDIMLEFKDCD